MEETIKEGLDKAAVAEMIAVAIKQAAAFATPKYGDTPTDALQLTPKKYVDTEIPYFGHVDNAGTAVILPTGWTSSVSLGLYTVTHNLGVSNYAVVVAARADANAGDPAADITFGVIGATNTNNFTVAFFGNTGVTTKISTHFNFFLKTP